MKKNDTSWLAVATTLSKKCLPSETAFCVGAVIVDANENEIATGYSRETASNKHAEEIAIEKALALRTSLKGATIYSSLEPCGERVSGRKTCVQWIVETGIRRVVFSAYESDKFVVGKGEELLKQAGIQTVSLQAKNKSY